MTNDKPQRMKLPKTAEPGIELDAHGEPIPVSQRTSLNRAKAVANHTVHCAAEHLKKGDIENGDIDAVS